MTDALVQQAIDLVSADVARSVGMIPEITGAIERRADELLEFADSGDLVSRLAEDIQQFIHDVHIDSVWPACPIHHRHPLWLEEDRGRSFWTCLETGKRIASIGDLDSASMA